MLKSSDKLARSLFPVYTTMRYEIVERMILDNLPCLLVAFPTSFQLSFPAVETNNVWNINTRETHKMQQFSFLELTVIYSGVKLECKDTAANW